MLMLSGGELDEFPLLAIAAEGEVYLLTVGNTPDDKDLIVALLVRLAVDDVVDLAARDESRLEVGPLFRENHASLVLEVVVGIGRGEGYFLGHASDLEGSVGGEALIELQEGGVVVLAHRVNVDGRHAELSVDAVENVPFHHLAAQRNLLHDDVAHACILHQIRLLLAVENQGVVVLPHEEMVHVPLILLNAACQLSVLKHLEREVDAVALQLAVGCKIEKEVIEKLVGSLWHWLLGNDAVLRRQCVGRGRVGNGRRVGARRLLVGAPRGEDT